MRDATMNGNPALGMKSIPILEAEKSMSATKLLKHSKWLEEVREALMCVLDLCDIHLCHFNTSIFPERVLQ